MSRRLDSLDVLASLALLTEDQREALVDSVVLGRSKAEIGRSMGCSRERVRLLVKEAEERLRNSRLWRFAA